MLKLYLAGICILLVAIGANMLANKTGLVTWYDFLNMLAEKGKAAFQMVSPASYVWLLIVYPLVLALGYKLGEWIYRLILASAPS